MATIWLLIVAVLIAGVGVAAVVAVLVFVILRGRPRGTVEPDDDAPTPLERAQNATEALSPGERERFRRWMDARWPPARRDDHGEGITS
jgi:hypothetical protein